jgi:hypothetical protein
VLFSQNEKVYVNEAAAQLCKLVASLLVRRDELFPLARQVVKDSGYQYSKGHSRSQFTLRVDDSMINHSSNSNASVTSGGNMEGGNSVGSSRTTSRIDTDPNPGSPRQSGNVNRVNEGASHLDNEDQDEDDEELDITSPDLNTKQEISVPSNNNLIRCSLPSEDYRQKQHQVTLRSLS